MTHHSTPAMNGLATKNANSGERTSNAECQKTEMNSDSVVMITAVSKRNNQLQSKIMTVDMTPAMVNMNAELASSAEPQPPRLKLLFAVITAAVSQKFNQLSLRLTTTTHQSSNHAMMNTIAPTSVTTEPAEDQETPLNKELAMVTDAASRRTLQLPKRESQKEDNHANTPKTAAVKTKPADFHSTEVKFATMVSSAASTSKLQLPSNTSQREDNHANTVKTAVLKTKLADSLSTEAKLATTVSSAASTSEANCRRKPQR